MKSGLIFGGVVFSKNARVSLQLRLRRDLGAERRLRGSVGEEREVGREAHGWEDVQEEGQVQAAHHWGTEALREPPVQHKHLTSGSLFRSMLSLQR